MTKKNENLILGASRLQRVGLGVSSQSWNESPGQMMGSSGGGGTLLGTCPLLRLSPGVSARLLSPHCSSPLRREH